MTTSGTTDRTPLDPEALEARPTLALEAQTRGEVDVQITTARRYPRSVRQFIDDALAMATLDEDTAAACMYALPRDGKTIDGPSARLAEICASAYGHMRVQARIVDEDDRFITARGEAWDIQRNVAIAFDVRRRITDKQGRKYKDDMIGVTGNAASSIALRNAIFKVIPAAFWRPIYEQCRKVAVGSAETLVSKRTKMLGHFQKMGVTEARLLATLGLRGVEDIGLEQLAVLRGTATAIKDGDTTVDDAFPATSAPVIAMPSRQSEPSPAASGALPVRIVEAEKKRDARGDGWVARTEGGQKLYTRDPVLGAALLAAIGELRTITAAPADAQGRRKLTALDLTDPAF